MLYAQLDELGVATPPLPDGPLGPAARRAAASAAAEAVARHLRAGGRGGEALWGLVLRTLRQAYYSADQSPPASGGGLVGLQYAAKSIKFARNP